MTSHNQINDGEHPDCPSCIIADALFPERKRVWRPVDERGRLPDDEANWPTESPDAFSFLDSQHDALLTMTSLRRIAEAAATKAGLVISFGPEYCRDIGPLLALALMKDKDETQIKLGSRTGERMLRVIHELGIDVDLTPEQRALVETQAEQNGVDLWPFPLKRRRDARRDELISAEQYVCDELCDEINNWLLQKHMALTTTGRRDVTKVFAELLDNAVAHANPDTQEHDGDWYIGAFMGRRPRSTEGEYDFKCHIALMSLGASMSQSLQSANGEIRGKRDVYREQCQSDGAEIPVECLDTVFAIQDGVSRMSPERGNGGTGLINMLDVVRELGDTQNAETRPRIAIVSGSACLHIDGEELEKISRPSDKELGRGLWLNEQNTSEQAPDDRNAFAIAPSFPGVLVTLSFHIDERQLQSSEGEE